MAPERHLGGWDPRGSRQDLANGGTGAPTGLTGGGTLRVESGDLDTLHKRLGVVIKDVDKLSTSIERLTTNLTAAGKAWSPITGRGTSAIGGGTTLSVSGFGTPISTSMTAPIVGPGPGLPPQPGRPSGASSLTTSPVRAIALSAMAEVGSGLAGQVNTAMSGFTSGGIPMDAMSRQLNVISGKSNGSTAGVLGTTLSLSNISNTGPTDRNTAIAALLANPMLTPTNKQQMKGITNFMNTIQQLSGGTLTAAGAANTANQLTSGPTLQAFQRLAARNGQPGQGLINPKTMGVNSPQQIFTSMLQAVMGGQQLSPAQMKAMTTREWATITQNNNVPGLGLGLSPQMLTELRMFAMNGGNIAATQKSIGNAGGNYLLGRTTATSRAKQTTYEQTLTTQNDINKAYQGAADAANAFVQTHVGKAAANLAVGASAAASGLLGVAEKAGEIVALFRGVKALSGGGGGGGGSGTGILEGLGLSRLLGGGSGTGAGLGLLGRAGIVGAAGVGAYMGTTAILQHNPVVGNFFKRTLGSTLGGLLGMKAHPTAKLGSGSIAYLQEIASGKIHNPHISKKDAQSQLSAAGVSSEGAFTNMGDPPTGATSTQGMTPDMKKKMSAMMAANPSIKISSGHRTHRQQSTLYAMKGGRGVAKPGHSEHQRGRAADVGPPSQLGWIARNASKFGLYRPAPRSEPWHLQAMGDPSSSGIVGIASSQIGVPYSWGGGTTSGPSLGIAQGSSTVGFDCSHFVQYVFAKVGINLPPPSQSQAKMGSPVKDISQAKPGDLLFFNYEGPNSHVGIYIGGGKMIDAPSTGQTIGVHNVDTGHLDAIRRVLSGTGGASAVAAAQASVGMPSSDSHSGSTTPTAPGTSLANTFLSMVQGSWLAGSGAAGAGGTSATSHATGGAGGSGGSSTSTATPSPGGGNSVVQAVRSVTSNRNVQIAMLTGAALESNQNPKAVGNGSYGAWQIQMLSGRNVTPQQAEDPNFAAQFMVGSYTSAVAGISKALWKSNPMQAAEQAAYAAERPAQTYFSSQGAGRVQSAYNLAVSEVGGPMGDPVMSSLGGGGKSVISMGGSGGHGPITVNMPLQVVGVSQQDAQMLAKMVISEIKSAEHQSMLGRA